MLRPPRFADSRRLSHNFSVQIEARSTEISLRPVAEGDADFLYGLYAEGVLADEGGVMSQTVKYLAIMRLIHGTVNECRAEQMEKRD